MYIYFNSQNIITTQIPHGEIIRQGSTFTLSMYFEGIEDVSKYSMSIAFKRPGDKEFGSSWIIDPIVKPNEVFKKVKTSEMTYSFIPGKEYKIYSYNCGTITGATERFGNVQAVLKLCEKKALVMEDDIPQTVENVIVMGAIQFYVEPTYGCGYESNISISQFNALMTYLNESAESVKAAYIKKIDYDSKTYTFTITKQDDSVLTVVLPFNEKVDSRWKDDDYNYTSSITRGTNGQIEIYASESDADNSTSLTVSSDKIEIGSYEEIASSRIRVSSMGIEIVGGGKSGDDSYHKILEVNGDSVTIDDENIITDGMYLENNEIDELCKI